MESELFTGRECVLWEALPPNQDVEIEYLYTIVTDYLLGAYGIDHPRTQEGEHDVTPRLKQQRLGSIISAMNKKLAKHGFSARIETGVGRRTYRLKTTT
jgi:hypothetical protein